MWYSHCSKIQGRWSSQYRSSMVGTPRGSSSQACYGNQPTNDIGEEPIWFIFGSLTRRATVPVFDHRNDKKWPLKAKGTTSGRRGIDEAERGSVPRLAEYWSGRCLVALPLSWMTKLLQPCQQPPVLCLLGKDWKKCCGMSLSLWKEWVPREKQRLKETRGSNTMKMGKKRT